MLSRSPCISPLVKYGWRANSDTDISEQRLSQPGNLNICIFALPRHHMKSGVIEGLHKSLKLQFVFALQFTQNAANKAFQWSQKIPQEEYSRIFKNKISTLYILYLQTYLKASINRSNIAVCLSHAQPRCSLQPSFCADSEAIFRNSEMLSSLLRKTPIRSGESFTFAIRLN